MMKLKRALGMSKPQDIPDELKSGDPDAHLTIVGFHSPGKTVIAASPFVGKVELILRIAGLEYETKIGVPNNAKHAPKLKFPVLRAGDVVVSDSTCITTYLMNTYPKQMAVLKPSDPQRQALATVLLSALEEHLYFLALYMTWQRDDHWDKINDEIFADVPSPMRGTVATMARWQVLRDLHGQGVGRHSLNFVKDKASEILDACDTMLASRKYLTGDTPTPADCFLFSVVEMVIGDKEGGVGAPELAAIIEARKNVVAMHSRMRSQYWPNGKEAKHWSEKLCIRE